MDNIRQLKWIFSGQQPNRLADDSFMAACGIFPPRIRIHLIHPVMPHRFQILPSSRLLKLPVECQRLRLFKNENHNDIRLIGCDCFDRHGPVSRFFQRHSRFKAKVAEKYILNRTVMRQINLAFMQAQKQKASASADRIKRLFRGLGETLVRQQPFVSLRFFVQMGCGQHKMPPPLFL